MSTSNALFEVLKQLDEEAKRAPVRKEPWHSWQQYRQWQQMWNPNWSPAAQIEIHSPGI